MKTTQRTAPAHARTWAHHFEASSVLLFAALTFGAAGAVQAQSGSSSNPAAPQATAHCAALADVATYGPDTRVCVCVHYA